MRGTDGKFDFKIDWPQMTNRKQNVWKQTSNPLQKTEGGVDGYEPVHVKFDDNQWGGLEFTGGHYSLLDGSVGHSNWYYAIGTGVPFSSGIPANKDPSQQ